jgi:metallo-beta-lactamase family protein
VKSVKIFGENFKVHAEVETINGLSAHADQHQLLDYALRVKDRVKHIFLVHGEANPATTLMEAMGDSGISNVDYPELGAEFELR